VTSQFPGTQRADLQVVRGDEAEGDTTARALGLLENARKVADATVLEARDEAERLLTAARERAQQVQRDAKELGLKLRSDAERDSAQARHEAHGEAERIVADARHEVSSLKASVAGLREERNAAESAMRELAERLQVALQRYGAPLGSDDLGDVGDGGRHSGL
jgi:vacuolar-type H+-ATPase subunit H